MVQGIVRRDKYDPPRMQYGPSHVIQVYWTHARSLVTDMYGYGYKAWSTNDDLQDHVGKTKVQDENGCFGVVRRTNKATDKKNPDIRSVSRL